MQSLARQTQALVTWAATATPTQLARRLGAHPADDHVAFGFWVPELAGVDEAFVEILTATHPLDLSSTTQQAAFQRERVPLAFAGETAWAAVEGVRTGSREQVGAFYWVAYEQDGTWHYITDPLAISVPFGVFAPAEVYDMAALDASRPDAAYFAALGDGGVQPPGNILQIHVGTGTEAGTLAGLARLYTRIAQKISAGQELTLAERNYIAYESVQLMPIEPTIEYEGELGSFWQVEAESEGEVQVTLRKPDVFNWGYDIVIAGSGAVNPAILETGRPDELVDFIAACHNMPGRPIKVIFDIVFGHADNQGLEVLNEHYFTGPNMYGQDMNFRHPMVRAIMLEMQRRKANFGVDGLRVDGAQDFKYWDEERGELLHDDDYLKAMSDIVQEVAGQAYRPWMIFEDGRPWPRDDWELASTYREVTKQQPDVFQWGPLTFAHNTPFLFTYWITHMWRLEEVARFGARWITGMANHDTMRRGTQVDTIARINTYLGESLPEIYRNAYDDPSINMLNYICMPGVPMDMINALMRAPWSFMRNTDDRYAVKVASEEARFLDWAIGPERYGDDGVFERLKSMGFSTLDELHRFWYALDHAVQITGYDQDVIVDILNSLTLAGPELTRAALKRIARAWMHDVYDLCNVAQYEFRLGEEHVKLNHAIREFRLQRPWLRENLGEGEAFGYLTPVDGSVILYGLRRSAEEEILFVMNAEGAPRTLIPADLPLPISTAGWVAALYTPGVIPSHISGEITLADSEAIVYTRTV